IEINKLEFLAKSPIVQWIEAVEPPSTPDDTLGKSSTRSNTLNTSYTGGRKYDGTGVSVALSDDGVIGPHIDFQGRATMHTTISSGNHGDMTSGIFVGAGNLNPSVGGMAPGSDIHIYKQGTTIFLSSYEHIVNGVENMNTLGTVITSTSYSQGQGGEYNTSTEFTDQQINENPNIIHVLSAGNSGTFDHGYGAGAGWANISGGIKAGKNVICAGNVNSNDQLSNTSSRGPAADGRIKPDLCAQGDGMTSTDQENTYQPGAGTSASTPAIAGILAQLYQAYRELNDGTDPETGLLKASLLNTARDLGNPGPDYRHGWGRINGLRAVKILEENRYIRDTIEHSEDRDHVITVPENVSQVRMMTYWTDVEGNPSAAVALVNDINMKVVTPEGVTYNPLVLDPTPNATALNTTATQGIDNLNNVEQVSIDNPIAGEYTLTVEGFAIPEGPQQYFILYDFIYNGLELTYPLGGEAIVPNESETIRWDASTGTENFTLEYSMNGGTSYNLISSNISSTARSFTWNVPNVLSNEVKLKISRGASNSESVANLTIVEVPQNLQILRVCPDTIELTWDAISGIEQYEISVLGEKYMDSLGISSSNSFNIVGLIPNDEHWFSVRSLVNDAKGRRAIAIRQEPGTQNCILNNDVELTRLITPIEGAIPDCRDLANTKVIIEVTNIGLLEKTDLEVNYQIDGGPIITENILGPLAPGESIEYQFSELADISSVGNYSATAWVVDPEDQNLFNDSVSNSVEVLAGIANEIPHSQNFNSFSTCTSNWNICNQQCGLSNGYINLENDVKDDIDWRVRSGATPSRSFLETGTNSDFSGIGSYIYLESIGGCTFKEGKLLSPCIDLTSESCPIFEFAYKMYGSQMGALHVDVITELGYYEDIMTPISGNQGDEWHKQVVDLKPYSGQVINLVLRGITGSGSSSVIVIDAFSVKSNAPQAIFDFDPDSKTFTNYSSGDVTDFFWDFGDNNTSTDENPTNEYEESGTYDVTLIVSGTCGSDTLTQTFEVTLTKLNDYQAISSAISVYPNPTNGDITIKLPIQLQGVKIDIKLMDVLGNQIMSFENTDKREIVIDELAVESGIIILEVSNSNFRAVKKIVIQE
ncbi:S8 family serine peptidase, partial [Saprospiraceae bacterium]|nr:S8 family serine peptidase [Saprospiraceae bacterium]